MSAESKSVRRGRRPLGEGQRHQYEISLRLTDAQHDLVRKAMRADFYDGTLVSFVRQQLLARLAERGLGRP